MARPRSYSEKKRSYFRGSGKHIPGSEVRSEEVFDFPFLMDTETIDCISNFERIMFIVRGPPGTGKNTLSSMIIEKYPSAVICSADKYFSQAFVKPYRNHETLRKSHEFCHRRVKEECKKGAHPIIVQNTHMKKFEMQPYMDFAIEFNYTVIMAVTLRKFKVDPEVLAKTNKKGLTSDYFRNRLQQWEENLPEYTGWFLSPNDGSFVLKYAKQAARSLMKDENFKTNFDVLTADELLSRYNVETHLFCIATCCKRGSNKKYYLSSKVQDVYGKCFTVSIQGFLITKSSVLGVAAITGEMKSLISKPDENDSLSDAFSSLNVTNNCTSKKSMTLEDDFSCPDETTLLHDWFEDEAMNINYMSFVTLAQNDEHECIKDVLNYAEDLFSEVVSEEGIIENLKFVELGKNTEYLKLNKYAYLLKPHQKIKVNTIFTGLYF